MIKVKEQLKDVVASFPIDSQTCIIAGNPTKEFIKNYVVKFDNDFYEPLSARVAMEAFSQKLSDLSTTFIIYDGNEVAGIICAYFYDPSSKAGFITLVHTRQEYRGRHYSLYLLNAVKEYAKGYGFNTINLIVSKQQISAYQLYTKHGFVVISEDESGRCKMECVL